ncbi:peptidoglycan glycosyltransferase FtsW [Corynebacterium efficiens]|uniref:Probable peptidoglycan glycosyltransferase FtsW n=1 Tax=Corynebacterium efficiens (strain DSM 44549 / YS-314 / AJ 12310 / JCM 11189 / NBRC 100395) TaxID=196164 RepID=Q8FNT9_COREF|nr:putative peptidoglycan glycosyltransferase FtsW [Corynebacterium efficiens]BAC18864.1 cell division protein FtsW [Corynebacterium efficiens YS-314]
MTSSTAGKPRAPKRAAGSTQRTSGSRTGLGFRERVSNAWNDILSRPLTDYIMILFTVILLSSLGVVMVYSSSMTWSLAEGGRVWSTALRQGMMIFAGFVALWLVLKFKPQTIRNLAPALLIISILLLLAVQIPGIGTGREEVGSQSWIVLGPLRFQPSEIAKVTIVIWGAHYLAGRKPVQHVFFNHYTRFAAVGGVMAALIFLEGDAGMAMSFALVVMFMLLFAGVALGWLVLAAVVVLVALVGMALGGGFRSNRFSVYFDALFGNFQDTRGTAFQSYQGFLSLADGSATGVGLGQSRAKWFYLPEAKNDFIFAIIGEELGLLGGALVIGLFATLLYFGLRTAKRSRDPFLSLMAATLTASVVSQAFINIGYVIGLLPVTGIQLPMISAGGTSAIITLAAMGLLANCARHEPEAVSAMASYGRPVVDRILMLPEPSSRITTRNSSRKPSGKSADGPREQAAGGAGRRGSDTRERFGEPVTARRSARAGSNPPSGAAGSVSKRKGSGRAPGTPAGAPGAEPRRAADPRRGTSGRGSGGPASGGRASGTRDPRRGDTGRYRG